jgi:hypothetical protein
MASAYLAVPRTRYRLLGDALCDALGPRLRGVQER